MPLNEDKSPTWVMRICTIMQDKIRGLGILAFRLQGETQLLTHGHSEETSSAGNAAWFRSLAPEATDAGAEDKTSMPGQCGCGEVTRGGP